MVLPPGFVVDDSNISQAERLVQMCAAWVEYAAELLRPGELDMTTAHNKVKHGLAVRGRSDLRVTFTTVGPDADGNVPLSAFKRDTAIDVLDRPVLEFLARPRLFGLPKQGLEVTQLRLDYRVILSEAAFLAFVHGALFHVVAYRHFLGRGVSELKIAPHPGFVGETPARIILGTRSVFGFPLPIPLQAARLGRRVSAIRTAPSNPSS